MKTIYASLLAAVTLCGVAAAQMPPTGDNPPSNPPQASSDVSGARKDVRQHRAQVKADHQKVVDLAKAHVDAVRAMNSKEKTDVDAAKADSTLTPDQRRAKIKSIRADYQSQRKSMNEQYRSDRKAALAALRGDRQAKRAARKELAGQRQAAHAAAQQNANPPVPAPGAQQ